MSTAHILNAWCMRCRSTWFYISMTEIFLFHWSGMGKPTPWCVMTKPAIGKVVTFVQDTFDDRSCLSGMSLQSKTIAIDIDDGTSTVY